MLIRYFMSTNVLTLSPEQTCLEAHHYFKKNKIRRAPVMDNDKMVGIVSESDLYRIIPCWKTSQQTNETNTDITIKDFMTTDVQVLGLNDHLEIAAKIMLQHKIGGIPILKDNKLEGLITESDIFEATWSILSQKTNHRIIFFDKGPETEKDSNDYIEMCFKHHCLVHTFVSYPKPDSGGYIYYLCVQGKKINNLITDLWAHSCEVIIVEKYDSPLTNESE